MSNLRPGTSELPTFSRQLAASVVEKPPFWAEPRWFLLIVLAYLVTHFAIRMAMWPTLGIDDAEQALFSQHFAWSYRYRAPPSFTWALLLLNHFADPGIFTISLLRYVLLAAIFVFAWLSARLLLEDRRLAALSAYGFSAIYIFGFYSHHDLTHTTALSAALAANWYFGLRLLREQNIGLFLGFGLTAGLGVISKWNFAVHLAAVAIVLAALPTLRRKLLFHRGMWVAIAAIAFAAGPTILSTAYFGPGGDGVSNVLGTGNGSFLVDRAMSVAKLTLSTMVYPQPLLIILIVCYWRFMNVARARRLLAWRNEPPAAAAVAALVTLVAIGLHYLIAILLGAANLNERLLQPALFMVPILAYVPADGARIANRNLNQYAGILLAVAMVAIAGRWGLYWSEPRRCFFCLSHLPIADLASDIRQSGYDGRGTILVEDPHLGGNLRVQFPRSRVADIRFPLRYWPEPASADGDCLIVAAVPAGVTADGLFGPIADFARTQLSAKLDAPAVEHAVELHILGSDTRTRVYEYRLYKGGSLTTTGNCR